MNSQKSDIIQQYRDTIKCYVIITIDIAKNFCHVMDFNKDKKVYEGTYWECYVWRQQQQTPVKQ